MDKVPIQVVKEIEHQARQNLCTLNFSAAFNQVISECNLIMESYRDSLKATYKCVKTQIQKGANPERAAKNGYERTCDYLEILDKRIHFKQRALACQSKALSHKLQRERYTMSNSILIRGGEMSHLQPNLGETKHHQLGSFPFAPTPLFYFKLVPRQKKATQKHSGLQALSKQPVCDPPTTRKEAPTGNAPFVGQSTLSSNQSFSSVKRNLNNRSNKDHFRPHRRVIGRGNLSSLSINTLPFVQERLGKRNVLKKHVKHYQ